MSEPDTKTSDPYRKLLVFAVTIGTAAGFLFLVRDFIVTLVMAFIFSAMLWPVYRKVLQWFGGREVLATATVILATVVVIGIPLLGFLGLVAAQAVQISKDLIPWVQQQLPAAGTESQDLLHRWVPWAENLEPFQNEITAKIGQWTGEMASFLLASFSSATQGAAIFALKFFVMLYAIFFFLRSGRALARGVVDYLPLERKESEQILERGLATTRATLKSILVIGGVQGLLLGVGFWIAGIKGAAFWGSVVVVLSAIPALGAPVIWGPASVYLIMDERILAGILLAIWGAAVVGTVDNILRPWLVGREVRLPDLLILVSTFGGISAFGPLGVILGPVIAAVAVMAAEIYRKAFL